MASSVIVEVGPAEIDIDPAVAVEIDVGPTDIQIGDTTPLSVEVNTVEVVVAENSLTVEVPSVEIEVGAVSGAQGPTGPIGDPGNTSEHVAAVTLSGHRAVAFDVDGELIYADASSNIAARGMIRDAVAATAAVDVYTGGIVSGFTGLIPEAEYFLVDDGQISTAPSVEYVQYLGYAIDANVLLLEIDPPVDVE